MLIDKVEVIFKAGDGGDGKVSFKKIGRGPDGGNGGNGGNLYVTTSSDLTLLNQFSRQIVFSAEDGVTGANNKRTGAKGLDLELILPIGTSIINKDTNEEIIELDEIGKKILLCKGGSGGFGNWEYKSSRNTTPMRADKGKSGQTLNLILNLKMIADYGLIGLPNSGKSSLLNELTGATAKTANYSFTTLSPNLGVFENEAPSTLRSGYLLPTLRRERNPSEAKESSLTSSGLRPRYFAKGDKIIADIPGLIEGASLGRGLGISFLKHIEKVKILLHCIDSTSLNYQKDYETVRKELGAFNKELLNKKEIVLLTKSDLVNKKMKFKKAISVSIYDFLSLEKLKELLS